MKRSLRLESRTGSYDNQNLNNGGLTFPQLRPLFGAEDIRCYTKSRKTLFSHSSTIRQAWMRIWGCLQARTILCFEGAMILMPGIPSCELRLLCLIGREKNRKPFMRSLVRLVRSSPSCMEWHFLAISWELAFLRCLGALNFDPQTSYVVTGE